MLLDLVRAGGHGRPSFASSPGMSRVALIVIAGIGGPKAYRKSKLVQRDVAVTAEIEGLGGRRRRGRQARGPDVLGGKGFGWKTSISQVVRDGFLPHGHERHGRSSGLAPSGSIVIGSIVIVLSRHDIRGLFNDLARGQLVVAVAAAVAGFAGKGIDGRIPVRVIVLAIVQPNAQRGGGGRVDGRVGIVADFVGMHTIAVSPTAGGHHLWWLQLLLR